MIITELRYKSEGRRFESRKKHPTRPCSTCCFFPEPSTCAVHVSRVNFITSCHEFLFSIALQFDYDNLVFQIRERCRKGIPMSVRPRAWLYLCGGKILLEKHPGLYETLCQKPGNVKYVDDIRKDLHRQFPQHEMFVTEDRPGQQELFSVLKAYTIWNSKDGYCQAQAPIAAFLLMHMPAEQAFWCLVSIFDRYLPQYYSPGLEVVQRDGDILEALLKRTCPQAYRHLKNVGAQPVLYMTEWFLCAFTRTLPWDSLLRLWDTFLCEGVKVNGSS